MNELLWRTLDQAAYFASGGTPSKANPAFWSGEIPWVSAKDMKSFRISDAEDHLTVAGLEAGSKLALRGSTLVLVRGMTLLNDVPICFVDCDVAFNQDVKALSPKEGVESSYLSYAVLGAKPQLLAHVDLAGHGTGKLPTDVFKAVRIRIPAADEQRAIAHVLGTLDDKIELNRRMSQTLEAIAQAIFKCWFVDFDPLLALSDGHDRTQVAARFGLSPEVIQLFSTELADVGGQVAPVGWKLSTLGQEVKAHGGLLQTGPFGSQLHASDYTNEGVPVVMPQDLVNRRIATGRVARIPQGTADGLRRHMLKVGDVVYSRRGDVERHALVSPREAGWLCGTGCLLVRMGNGWSSQAYLSETLNDKTTRDWIVRHAVGATMPNLNTSILASVPLLVPPAPLLRHFESVVGTLREQQETLSAEAESLAALRDELLPRLLSGELAVA